MGSSFFFRVLVALADLSHASSSCSTSATSSLSRMSSSPRRLARECASLNVSEYRLDDDRLLVSVPRRRGRGMSSEKAEWTVDEVVRRGLDMAEWVSLITATAPRRLVLRTYV